MPRWQTLPRRCGDGGRRGAYVRRRRIWRAQRFWGCHQFVTGRYRYPLSLATCTYTRYGLSSGRDASACRTALTWWTRFCARAMPPKACHANGLGEGQDLCVPLDINATARWPKHMQAACKNHRERTTVQTGIRQSDHTGSLKPYHVFVYNVVDVHSADHAKFEKLYDITIKNKHTCAAQCHALQSAGTTAVLRSFQFVYAANGLPSRPSQSKAVKAAPVAVHAKQAYPRHVIVVGKEIELPGIYGLSLRVPPLHITVREHYDRSASWALIATDGSSSALQQSLPSLGMPAVGPRNGKRKIDDQQPQLTPEGKNSLAAARSVDGLTEEVLREELLSSMLKGVIKDVPIDTADSDECASSSDGKDGGSGSAGPTAYM